MKEYNELRRDVERLKEIAKELGDKRIAEIASKIEEKLDILAIVDKETLRVKDTETCLEIEIPFMNTKKVKFEAIGVAGEYDYKEDKLEPMSILIGSVKDVRNWLRTFGGLDLFEYVRYDEYEKLLKKVKKLEKRVQELELELAGKEKPVV